MLPGGAALQSPALELGTETADTTSTLSDSISGLESQMKSDFAMGASVCFAPQRRKTI